VQWSEKESGAWLVGNWVFGVFPNNAVVVVWVLAPDAGFGVNEAVSGDEITDASIRDVEVKVFGFHGGEAGDWVPLQKTIPVALRVEKGKCLNSLCPVRLVTLEVFSERSNRVSRLIREDVQR